MLLNGWEVINWNWYTKAEVRQLGAELERANTQMQYV